MLYGPGWGNAGTTNTDRPTSEADGTVGIAALRRAGYNVLTWDPRGFGASGGEAKWDSPDYEARDVQALLDALAGLPEAQLDEPGDPRVGMAGASYGGGIQWVTAAIDNRVEAITPVRLLALARLEPLQGRRVQGRLGRRALRAGECRASRRGWSTPTGVQAGSMDPHMYSICQSGLLTGRLATGDRDWLESRGPGGDVGRSRAHARARARRDDRHALHARGGDRELPRAARERGAGADAVVLRRPRHVPDRPGVRGLLGARDPALARHLREGRRPPATGPRFEWVDQQGDWHQASDYPLADAGSLTATGSRTLQLVAGDAGSSGTATSATPRASGVDIADPAPDSGRAWSARPHSSSTTARRARRTHARAYAQIVDEDRDIVIGGQVTPIPLELDNQEHTLRVNLETLAYALSPSSSLRLEIVPASNVYGSQRSNGRVELKRVALTLPLGKDPGGGGGNGPPPPGTPARRRSRRSRSSAATTAACGSARGCAAPGSACAAREDLGRRRRWSRRTERSHLLRVRPEGRRLVVRFRHGGERHKVRVPIDG